MASVRSESTAGGARGYPPDYENYDYRSEWKGRRIEDMAEKAVLRMWLRRSHSGLELGGGFGRLTSLLEQYFTEVVMLDFSKSNLGRAKRNTRKTRLARSDVASLPFRDGVFDLVLMVRVIHHLPDPEVVLREIKRVSKDGATVILSTPNTLFGRYRPRKRGTLVAVGPQGHRIYASPLHFFRDALDLTGARGTGLFDNFAGKALERLGFLYLADVATSPLWIAKPHVFLRYRVAKSLPDKV